MHKLDTHVSCFSRENFKITIYTQNLDKYHHMVTYTYDLPHDLGLNIANESFSTFKYSANVVTTVRGANTNFEFSKDQSTFYFLSRRN